MEIKTINTNPLSINLRNTNSDTKCRQNFISSQDYVKKLNGDFSNSANMYEILKRTDSLYIGEPPKILNEVPAQKIGIFFDNLATKVLRPFSLIYEGLNKPKKTFNIPEFTVKLAQNNSVKIKNIGGGWYNNAFRLLIKKDKKNEFEQKVMKVSYDIESIDNHGPAEIGVLAYLNVNGAINCVKFNFGNPTRSGGYYLAEFVDKNTPIEKRDGKTVEQILSEKGLKWLGGNKEDNKRENILVDLGDIVPSKSTPVNNIQDCEKLVQNPDFYVRINAFKELEEFISNQKLKIEKTQDAKEKETQQKELLSLMRQVTEKTKEHPELYGKFLLYIFDHLFMKKPDQCFDEAFKLLPEKQKKLIVDFLQVAMEQHEGRAIEYSIRLPKELRTPFYMEGLKSEKTRLFSAVKVADLPEKDIEKCWLEAWKYEDCRPILVWKLLSSIPEKQKINLEKTAKTDIIYDVIKNGIECKNGNIKAENDFKNSFKKYLEQRKFDVVSVEI